MLAGLYRWTMGLAGHRHAVPALLALCVAEASLFPVPADLLLIPIVVPLMPVLYNRIEPTLLGLPFFYWGQLSFAFLASVIIAVVHRKVR